MEFNEFHCSLTMKEEIKGFVLSDEVRQDFTEEAVLDQVPRGKV